MKTNSNLKSLLRKSLLVIILALSFTLLGQTPIAYYPLTGSANDAVGSNHGTVNGATLTTDRFGNANSAYSFDGLDDYITVPSGTFTAYTISAWVKFDGSPVDRGIVTFTAGSSSGSSFGNWSHQIRTNATGSFRHYSAIPGAVNLDGSTISAQNTWYHVAISANANGQMKLYVNGIPDATPINVGSPWAGGNHFHFGNGSGFGANLLHGAIDEVKIYNTQLSDAQIIAEFNSNSAAANYANQFGNSVLMDGNHDYIELGNSFTQQNFTVEMWLKPGATQVQYADIIDNNHTGYQNWVVQQDGNSINSYTFAVHRNSGGTAVPFQLTANQWQHVAFVKNATSISAYVNGMLVQSAQWTGTVYYSNQMLRLGNWVQGGRTWNGSMDEVRYWSSARTATEIQSNMNAQLTGNETDLVGYWNMNRSGQGSGLTVVNEAIATGTALNGTTFGTVSTPVFTPGVIIPTPQQAPGSGNSLSFDGVGDAISSSNQQTAFDNFTIETWVNPTSTTDLHSQSTSGYPGVFGTNRYLISPLHGGNSAAGAGISVGTNGVCVFEHGHQYLPSLLTWTGTISGWTHIAVVYTNKQPSLYLNGVLVATGLTSNRSQIIASNSEIGGGGYGHYQGEADEIRIWSSSLTEAQIRDRMCRKITSADPLYANLAAYYNFDESTGSTVFDGSSNINNGTMVNSPTRVTSGAAIGNSSAHNYVTSGLPAANLSINAQDILGVNYTAGTYTGTAGTHVYAVYEAPNTINGIAGVATNDRYFGIFNANLSSPSYTATYNYTGNPTASAANESLLKLYRRSDNAATTWALTTAAQDINANTLTLTGQSTEYMLGADTCVNLTGSFSATACQSYVWGDSTYTTSGAKVQTLVSANGCDSIVTLNLTITPPLTWYLDADLDGHYTQVQAACTTPGAGWTSAQPANGFGDCDDSDISVWQTGQFFADADGDGYSPNPTASTICYGATLPTGLIATSLGLDCDDSDISVWQTGQYFVDADGDGYSPNSITTSVCFGATLPAGLIATSLGADCDDNNLLINAGAQYVEFSGGSNFTSSLIYPEQGTSYTNFQFEATYFDANGALPPPTYPRVYLDYEGNGVYNNANDRAIIMTPFDAGDLNTADGKRYIGTINTLPNGTTWETSVQVTAGSCLTQIGPFSYPDVLVLPDLQIFANNITFSSANPAVSSPLTINAVITNVSDYAAQNFVVHLVNEYDANIVYPDIVVSNLAANSSTTVTWNITTPATPAWCPMRVLVDYTNVIAESNELDNNAVRPFTNGNFVVPGTIVVSGNVAPPVSFSSTGNVLSFTGTAAYSGVPTSLSNLSVAGAEVNFTIIETGANFIGYTDAQGNFNLPFAGPLGAGNYTLTGFVTDFTLTGSLANIPFTILPICKPDLTATLTVSSNTIIAGQSITSSVLVTNYGCATAPASLLTFNQSGGSPTLSPINVPSLAPGASFTTPLSSIMFATAGNYGICSTADGDFAIDEANESNNVSCQNFSVLPVLPDLAVQNGPGSMAFNCIGTVPIYAEVANTGGSATGNFNCLVHVKQGLTIVQTFNVPVSSIASQSYTAFSVNFNVPANGNYTVEIICDNNEVIAEVNENNNASEFSVDILLCQPDLTVGDCELVDAVSANNTYVGMMDLNATIFNNGNATAFGPIDVKFELSNGSSYTTQILGNLTPGASAMATVPVSAFVSTSTTLTVIADYTNNIAELQELNNQSLAKHTSWEFYPVANNCGNNFWDAQYLANQAIYLSAAFRVDELYDAATLDVKFEVAGPGIIGKIDLGNAQAVNVEQTCGTCPRIAVLPNNFVFGQVGIYTFTMTVDPANIYAETNEANNVLVVTVEVTNLPDMRTLSQFINPSALNPLLNQNVTFAVTYENIGASNITDQMRFNLLVDNVLVESAYPVNGLVTNDNATYNFSLPWSSNVPGAHIIRAIIDSDDDVLEQTNANNEATRAIVVGDAANLFFNLFTSPTLNPNLNDPMQIVVEVKNNGALGTTADVKFYYVDDFLNEVLIDTRCITSLGNDVVSLTVPWMVLDNKTTIIGRIVNSTALEFDYSDNEASFKIGAMNLVLQATEACDPGNLGSITVQVTGGIQPYNYSWSNGSASSTLIDVAGTYNLVVTDNTGQTTVGGATIDECSVNCIPDATSFFETACNSYLWNGVVYTASGQYVNTFTNKWGCDSVVTLNLTLSSSNSTAVSCSISSTPGSAIYTGGSSTTLYLGYGTQSTTLTATVSGGSSWTYNWSGNTALLSNTNSSNPLFTPVMGGLYTFTVTTTNEFGCIGTCDITINVVDARCGKSNNPKVIVCHNGHEICISANAVPAHLSNHSGDIIGPCPPAKAIPLSNHEDELEIVTYPSPFTDAFHVELITTSASNYSISLFDMNGKLLEKHENLQMADNPDFGRDLPQGIYVVEVTQDGVRKMAKVSKVY